MALGISDAVSLSGRVLELVKAGATLELQERIMELREPVLNAKDELLSLPEELSELNRAGRGECEPCQRWYDVTLKLVRLQSLPAGSGYGWRCTACSRIQ